MHLIHELILCMQITRGRVHFNRDSTAKSLCLTFRHRSSLICSCTFLTGFGHFHGSTRSGPIQVASTLGDRFAAVASKLSGTQSRLSQSLYTLKYFAAHLLGFNTPAWPKKFTNSICLNLHQSKLYSRLTNSYS